MNKIKAAVIGVGNMGKNHVRTYAEIPDVNLIAVADLNEGLGDATARDYNVKYYKDYNEMLAVEKIDLVSICVPTIYHYEVARNCMKKKVNVLLEKPITDNILEAKKLLKLAKQQNIKFLVGHIERFNPAVKKVKEILDKKELGDVIAIIARRVGGFPPQINDANIGIDLAIHDVDVVNYLFNQLPGKVYVNKQRNHIINRDDSIDIFLKYSKATAYIQSNWITPVKIRKLNISGTDGYIEMDYITQKIEFYKSNYEKFIKKIGNYSDYILRFSEPDKIIINVAKKEPLKEEILYIISSIKQDLYIDSTNALEALRIVLQ